MKNFIQAGNSLTLPAPYDLLSGQGALVDSIFGVSGGDYLAGISGEFDVCGVFDLKKKTTDTPALGAKAYWDDTAREVTTTSTANTLIGAFTVAAGNGDATVNVRLNGSF